MTQQRFQEMLDRAQSVPYRFPEGPKNRIGDLGVDGATQAQIGDFAQRTRPIAHAALLGLLREFLVVKQNHGSAAERRLYSGMDEWDLVDRLLCSRPLAFVGPADSWLLKSGERAHGGFDQVGTDGERKPLLLENLLSYDEIQLSALLGVSVPTFFVNCGDRYNAGKPGIPGSFVESGVYVGLVGTRFEREERMEWQHMVVTAEQNTVENGYGPVDPEQYPLLACWARFYRQDDGFPLFPQIDGTVQSDEDFLPLSQGYLNVAVYRRRLRMSIEPFLLDARERAREEGRRAYLHVVGLGLGVWGVHQRQGQIMCDVYAELLREHREFGEHVSDIDFSWFPAGCTCGGSDDGGMVEDIRIHFSARSPADPLEDPDRLLVAMYAWDGNAFPGNEYWLGSLTASGDPAAACCSLIPELQNPDINRAVSGRRLVVYP